jgi:hypothetical protein
VEDFKFQISKKLKIKFLKLFLLFKKYFSNKKVVFPLISKKRIKEQSVMLDSGCLTYNIHEHITTQVKLEHQAAKERARKMRRKRIKLLDLR